MSLLLFECVRGRVSIFNIRCRELSQLCNPLYDGVSVINALGQMGNLCQVSAASAFFHGSLTQRNEDGALQKTHKPPLRSSR